MVLVVSSESLSPDSLARHKLLKLQWKNYSRLDFPKNVMFPNLVLLPRSGIAKKFSRRKNRHSFCPLENLNFQLFSDKSWTKLEKLGAENFPVSAKNPVGFGLKTQTGRAGTRARH